MIKTFLVAEDDPNDIFLLQRAFQKAGVELNLHCVADRQAAIDYLEGQGDYSDRALHPLPDLVSVDLKMPRKNGFDVLEWIRAQPGLRRLPVIVFTSSSLTSDVNKAYYLGANSYLVKTGDPFQMIDIAKSVTAYWIKINHPPQIAA